MKNFFSSLFIFSLVLSASAQSRMAAGTTYVPSSQMTRTASSSGASSSSYQQTSTTRSSSYSSNTSSYEGRSSYQNARNNEIRPTTSSSSYSPYRNTDYVRNENMNFPISAVPVSTVQVYQQGANTINRYTLAETTYLVVADKYALQPLEVLTVSSDHAKLYGNAVDLRKQEAVLLYEEQENTPKGGLISGQVYPYYSDPQMQGNSIHPVDTLSQINSRNLASARLGFDYFTGLRITSWRQFMYWASAHYKTDCFSHTLAEMSKAQTIDERTEILREYAECLRFTNMNVLNTRYTY